MSVAAVPAGDKVVREARLAQVLAAVWMVIEAVVAIAAGLAAQSVALVAFGADSIIEVFSATTVLRRLGIRPDDAPERSMERSERNAARIVGWALYALIVYIVLSSGWTLLTGIHPEPSVVGIALAVAALIVMPFLWRWRLRLSEQLHSPALRADAACSAVCVYMAGTLLAGLLLNRLFGWWWADPVAGLAMIWWIRGEAAEALESARTGIHCEDCAPQTVEQTS
jgi:divalent metal cation (Fe/Co/Zn/Cd) transporter